MKKIISLLLVMILMLSCGICASASEEPEFASREYWKKRGRTIVNNVVYKKDKNSYTAIDFLDTDESGNFVKEIVITDKIDGLPVTKIECLDVSEDGYFRDAKNTKSVKKIVLSDTIKRIGAETFVGYDSVETIRLSNSLKYIGAYSFSGLDKVKKLTLPDTVTHIGKLAFWGMKSLEKITLPKSLKNTPESGFGECISLKSVTFKSNIKNINAGTFIYCKNLKSISLPNTVEKIGASAFDGCKSLKKITIPKNVKKIGRSAFKECKKLSKVVFKGYKCPEIDPGTKIDPGTGKISTFYSTFGKTKKGIRFQVRTRAIAKQLKAELKNTGVKKAKIYVGDNLIYKNVK